VRWEVMVHFLEQSDLQKGRDDNWYQAHRKEPIQERERIGWAREKIGRKRWARRVFNTQREASMGSEQEPNKREKSALIGPKRDGMIGEDFGAAEAVEAIRLKEKKIYNSRGGK